MAPHRSESTAVALWQAGMAVIIVVTLGGVKPAPQIVLLAALLTLVVLQRVFATELWARQLRTGVLVLSTGVGMLVAGYVIAGAAMPRPAHPRMPIAELAVGIVAGTSSAIVMLWRRTRRPASGTDAGGVTAAAEPRLARVVEVFALAVAVHVAVEALE